MKRLLLVFIAVLAFGCGDPTEPGNSSLHKIPKVGSTFTSSLTDGAYHSIEHDTVMSTGVRFNGKPNVMIMTDSSMIAFEPNGEISFPLIDGYWVSLPLASKKDTTFVVNRLESGDGNYIVIEERVHFLNVTTKVLQGKNYDNIRFEVREFVKTYGPDDALIEEFNSAIFGFGWIPDLGYYGSTEYESPGISTAAHTELLDFNLK